MNKELIPAPNNRKSKIQDRKWVGFVALVVTLVMGGAVAQAQQPKKVPRIGYLSPLSPSSDNRAAPFRQGLRDFGYVEGKNIFIEYRYAQGKFDRLPALATELVDLKVDIILAAGGNNTIEPAKNATKTIPIVMMGQGADPVEEGFVESLARPGGNITGLTNLSRELGGKRLELLKEAVPKLGHVGVFYDPGTGGTVREAKDLPVVARGLGLTVHIWEVRDPDGLERIFGALNKERPDGLYPLITGGLMTANVKRISGFAIKSRLPSVSNTQYVEAGGLMSYGAGAVERNRRAATYVDRILKGAKPAELPVEQPTKFEPVINLKTAKQIGVTIPQSMLYRADKVIQ
jgi:putative ABC transport system substrate-binding protein